MYNIKPNLMIGFHGCDADVCKSFLNTWSAEIQLWQYPQ